MVRLINIFKQFCAKRKSRFGRINCHFSVPPKVGSLVTRHLFVPPKMVSLITILFLALILPYQGFSQREGNIWYFGKNAALDFNRWIPRALNNSQMSAREGCASISNSDGKLLFYTNGETVWNSEHKIMVNGEDLNGNQTATQSGVVVPDPGNHQRYYIFTVDAFSGGNGLSYSIVDMRIPGGGGIQSSPNQKNLKPPGAADKLFTEKITSVKHSNDKDYWVIAHLWGNREFYVYKVTSSGVSNPLPIPVGLQHGRPGVEDRNRQSTGYLKVSPKGNKLAVAIEGDGIIELFDFNIGTGNISNPIRINGIQNAYGLEFSISEEFLYASQRKMGGRIFQWDISKSNVVAIQNSQTVVGEVKELSGALQLAPNGKIYLAVSGKPYLSVVFAPNKRGIDCNFKKKGVSLGEGLSYMGLPTFVSTFFEGDGFIYTDVCLGDETQFYFTSIYEADKMLWDFGDGTTSDEVHPVHYYANPGIYIVSLTTERKEEDPATISKEITVFPLPDIDLGGDKQNVCFGNPLVLDAGEGHFWLWNTGSEARIIDVWDAGKYWVTLTDSNLCSSTAEVDVTVVDLPVVDSITTFRAFCGGSNGSATVYPAEKPENYLYEWFTDPPQYTRTASNLKFGRYKVNITSIKTGCILSIDTVAISEYNAPDVSIESLQLTDTVCPGTPVKLVAHGAQRYTWQNDFVGDTILVYPMVDTVYSVTGTATEGSSGQECSAIAQIPMNVFPQLRLELGEDQEKCAGETFLLDAATGNHWLWQDSSDLRTFLIDTTGMYSVAVTDTFKCVEKDSVFFQYHPLPVVDFGPDSTSCMGNEIVLDAGQGALYLWSDSTTSRYKTIVETGNYGVTVTSEHGCDSEDDINLIFYSMDSLRIDSVIKTDVSCYGYDNGTIDIYATGQVGYFNYSIDGGITWFQNDGIFTNLKAGMDYEIIVSERHACEKDGPVIHISQPEKIVINADVRLPTCEECTDGKITIKATGGILPYRYLWMNYQTGNTMTDISTGSYSVAVIDSLQCKELYRVNVDFAENPFLVVPSAFTPNGDGINDLWKINKVEEFPDIFIRVYNSRGKLVFTSKGYTTPWDGKNEGVTLPTNTYYYFIELGDGSSPRNGTVTIVR